MSDAITIDDLDEYERTQAGSGWPKPPETPSTVHLTQFMRPRGRREDVTVELTPELATKAKEMALSCEVLMSGEVVIYGRWKDEDDEAEYMEMATNTPGPKQPDLVTAKVIEKVWDRRQAVSS